MIRLLAFLLLFSAPVTAQEITTDAFGILPSSAMGDRANWAGLRETSNSQSTIQPAGPADAAVLFVGPKSIVAGQEPGHAVAIGLDVHGNMLDGADSQFVLGFGGVRVAETRHGIADLLFTPQTVAGDFLAGADIEGIQSARAHYRVTAHLATVLPQFASASQRMMPETFDMIATAPLVDAYGNLVDDGVGLSVILKDEAGQFSYLPSVVRDGTGQSTLLSRDLSGSMTGDLALAGTTVDGLSLTVEEMVLADAGTFHLWAEPTIAAAQLRLGPLATDAGFLVPDGMAGSIKVAASDGTTFAAEAWVLDGYLSFTLPLDPQALSFHVTLSIGENMETRTVRTSAAPMNANIRGAE